MGKIEQKMKNIAIIPARSGSKGLKDKNIKKLQDLPLLAYSIRAAQKSGCFEEIMVSTDSERYAEIAKKYGANVPFLRSEALSGDFVGSWEVVEEVLRRYQTQGKTFDSICLLQPTSPLRTAEDIAKGYHFFIEKGAEAVTGVCEVEHSPLWTMVLPEDCSMHEYHEKRKNAVPRQLLEPYYRINGALYIRTIKYKQKSIELKEEKEYAYIMERTHSVDIDTEMDFQYAEFLLERM